METMGSRIFIKTILLSLFFYWGNSTICAQQYKPCVSILGDSYSTYEGYVTPVTNEVWYYAKPGQKTDVESVKQTWWHRLICEMNYRLCINNSYSGSTICYSGYDGNDYSARSFLNRMDNLGCPDIIFIFGATNDSWANSPLGEYKYGDFTFGDYYYYRPALSAMLFHMQQRYPNVKLYFLLNDGLRDEISQSTKVICQHYNVKCITLKDIDKVNGHPTIKGHCQIAQQVKSVILSCAAEKE